MRSDNNCKILHFVIKLLPIGAVLAALAISGKPLSAAATLLAVIIHEGGHLVAAALIGIKPNRFSLGPLGARLEVDTAELPYGKEIALAAAGPVSNLLGAAYALPMTALTSGALFESVCFFIAASVGLAILNLLPIKSFDGGRILSCALSLISDRFADGKLAGAVSFLFLFALWVTSVYLILRTGASLSLFTFSVTLFVRLTDSKAT